MKTLHKYGILIGCLFLATAVSGYSRSQTLNETLYRTVCERVQTPLVFSTRDTLFTLSLPADEPAEIYLQLTVGKNGKVKDKLTKVHANHIANYVAPAFAAATEELRIDRELLAGMQGKDTSLILTFPMEYQCVYDTINREWSNKNPIPNGPMYYQRYQYATSTLGSNSELALQKRIREGGSPSVQWDGRIAHAVYFRVWYYLAFIHEPE